MIMMCTITRAFIKSSRRIGLRVHRRRPLQQPSPEALEVNRAGTLMQRVLSTIHNNSILLCGGPGSGKTSILLHLKKRLEEDRHTFEEFFPIFIDLHEVPEDQLFSSVANAVTDQLSLTPLVKKTGRAPTTGPGYSHRNLTSDIRRALHTLRKRGVRRARLVLLVDGIDQLNTFSAKTAQQVRSLFMANLDGNLVMVATAVEIDREWNEEGSPWYNFFEEIHLTPVNHQAEHAWHPG